jgi:hypothetical protein
VYGLIENLEGTCAVNVFTAWGREAREFVEAEYGKGVKEIVINRALVSC